MEQMRKFHMTCKTGYNNSPFNAVCRNLANTKWTVFKIPIHHHWQKDVGDWKGVTQHRTLTNGYVGKDNCNLTDSTAIRESQTSKSSSTTRKTRCVHKHMGLHYRLVVICRKMTAFYTVWPPQLTLHTLTCSCLMDSDFSEHFLSERCRFSWHSKSLCSAALSNSGYDFSSSTRPCSSCLTWAPEVGVVGNRRDISLKIHHTSRRDAHRRVQSFKRAECAKIHREAELWQLLVGVFCGSELL